MTFGPKDSGGLLDISLGLQGVSLSGKAALIRQIEGLWSKYYDSVYRYLLLTGSTPADADEFTQEAFLRLFRSLTTGRKIDKPKSWLLAVAHNLRLDEKRKGDQTNSGVGVPFGDAVALQVDPALDPERAMLERERLDRVRSAMASLTERQLEYLNLRAEGLKLREIAEIYGVAVQSVAEACSRAIERLRQITHE